jgi:prepilin-type N-terminal cleavage/methylation domain-containing protein
MKRPSPVCTKTAFTLVELLVVISIIVILMSLLLTAVPAVKKSGQKLEARNMAAQIVTAVNAYYTEYAKFPPVLSAEEAKAKPPSADEDTVVGDPDAMSAEEPNNKLFHTLRAIPKGVNESNRLNPRKVVFMEAKAAIVSAQGKARAGFFDRNQNGTEPAEEQDGCLYDPWGYQYGVVLDTTGDERINLKNFYTDFTGDDPTSGKAPRKRAGAFSVGFDGMLGKKGNKTYRTGTDVSDDVISWE